MTQLKTNVCREPDGGLQVETLLMELALRESEDRMHLAEEAADAGLWMMEADTGRIWATASLRQLIHFPPNEDLNYESLFKVVHPEDHELVRQAVRQAVETNTDLRVDYRVVLPDGSIRWIVARGSPRRESHGASPRLLGVVIDVTDRKRSDEQLRQTLDEVQRLRDELQQQNVYLREEVKALHGHTRLTGQSQALKHVLAQVEQVARTSSTVLVLGETGTGKELIAASIHEASPRRDRAMVHVNCAAIPAALIESELFGHERGSYTGALSRQIGRFEAANRSTIFLDEVGELPSEVQVKLLRVLQEKEVERLGSLKPIRVDVRIIAATNLNLERAVREGRVRPDLFYRLNVFPITVPPLRERREDIPALVSAFVDEFGPAFGKHIESVARESMDALQRYDWPGNVRELRNVIERAMIVTTGPKLWIDPPGPMATVVARPLSMKDTESEHIRRVLQMTGWRIRGRGGAAEILGMKPTTLESRMAKLGIRREGK